MHVVKIVFLVRAVHVEGQSLESACGDFYYLAVRKLMKGLLHFDTVRLAKCTYEQNAAIYADSLVNGLIGDSFDAIAVIPTSDRKAQVPYFRAIEQMARYYGSKPIPYPQCKQHRRGSLRTTTGCHHVPTTDKRAEQDRDPPGR